MIEIASQAGSTGGGLGGAALVAFAILMLWPKGPKNKGPKK